MKTSSSILSAESACGQSMPQWLKQDSGSSLGAPLIATYQLLGPPIPNSAHGRTHSTIARRVAGMLGRLPRRLRAGERAAFVVPWLGSPGANASMLGFRQNGSKRQRCHLVESEKWCGRRLLLRVPRKVTTVRSEGEGGAKGRVGRIATCTSKRRVELKFTGVLPLILSLASSIESVGHLRGRW